ncbi:hypothetical protein NDU88_000877 [Pleurodeles waltl]|uniref:UPAR/Ly6 domain-containing protein n=1 Tax=Pleurodeles waltl TaxID=8319 RepID=A0AAV7Q5B8_PLEWA|nr:hypothetical protein NDU88_000877 [Pleurodeles waltl]
MRPWVLPATVAFCLALSVGNALLCYRYEVASPFNRATSTCPPVRMLCQENETCASYTMTTWNQDSILARSCLEPFRCGNITSKTVHEITYDIRIVSCCGTDLCNMADAPRVSVLSAFSVLLLWVLH